MPYEIRKSRLDKKVRNGIPYSIKQYGKKKENKWTTFYVLC